MRRILPLLALLPLLAAEALAQGILLDPAPPGVPPREPWPVRLVEHRIDVKVVDQAAVFEVVQVFHNPNPWPGEGVYLFPLPEGASASRFALRMGEKEVPGELLDAERAREIYLSIVHRRRDPGLLEYAGRGLIRARVFPIPARGEMKVTLRFEQLLSAVGGLVELVYPLRTDAFGPGLVRTAATIDVSADAGVSTIFSPTHRLDVVRKDATRVVASFEKRAARPDRDLRILYGVGAKELGFHLASTKPAGEDGTFLLLLSPNTGDGASALAKEIVFVLDTSGSMGERGGEKIRQAKAALGYALGRLGPRDRFNIVAFATAPRPFRDRPVDATAENVRAALSFVEGLEATGGTAIHDALLSALRLEPGEERVPLVLFLTDGEATVGPVETPAILAAVEAANAAHARIFSLGVGDDLNAALLTGLADRTRGNAVFLSESEGVELKVSALYDQIASPVLADVTLRIEGAGIHDVHPARIGDLFKGQQVAILGRYGKPGAFAVTLAGKLAGREVAFTHEGVLAAGPERDYLPRLWAIRQVGFLLGEIRKHGEKPELVEEIRRLGTRHGIVTPYTSFLVVEEERIVVQGFDRAAPPSGPGAAWDRRLAEDRKSILESLEAADRDAELAGGALKTRQEGGKAAVVGARLSVALRDAGTDGAAGVGVKRAGGKTFRLVDGVWEDTEIAGNFDGPVVRVGYLSAEYVRLLADARLARYLSVGDRARILHDGRLYEVVP